MWWVSCYLGFVTYVHRVLVLVLTLSFSFQCFCCILCFVGIQLHNHVQTFWISEAENLMQKTLKVIAAKGVSAVCRIMGFAYFFTHYLSVWA